MWQIQEEETRHEEEMDSLRSLYQQMLVQVNFFGRYRVAHRGPQVYQSSCTVTYYPRKIRTLTFNGHWKIDSYVTP